jgi:hypothetical protein
MKTNKILVILLFLVATTVANAKLSISPSKVTFKAPECTDNTVKNYISDIRYVVAKESLENTVLFQLQYPANSNHSKLIGKFAIYKDKKQVKISKGRYLSAEKDSLSADSIVNSKSAQYQVVAIFALDKKGKNRCKVISNKFNISIVSTPTPKEPSLTVISTSSTTVKTGETYSVTFRARDDDRDLKQLEINWGDRADNVPEVYPFSSNTSRKEFTMTHTYANARRYDWGATLKDKSSSTRDDKKVGSVKVEKVAVSLDKIINYLDGDSVISKMSLKIKEKQNSPLSKSDAIVLIDRLLILNGSAENKMSSYTKVFPDAPLTADYHPSLMRLAYYKNSSFGATALDKDNLFFNSMNWMTRQEFLKVAILAFDIPKRSFDLSSYDTTDMASWAEAYFETAVASGIVQGSDPKSGSTKRQLEAAKKISIYEAIMILSNINTKFPSSRYKESNYEPAGSSTPQVAKFIGVEYPPVKYLSSANPISIANVSIVKSLAKLGKSSRAISQTDKDGYVLLKVEASSDTANGASPYYWWNTDNGYFKKVSGVDDFSQVYFYPSRSKPLSDYHIIVSGADGIGYVDGKKIEISRNHQAFTYHDDKTVNDDQIKGTFVASYEDKDLVANREYSIDFKDTKITKNGIDLGIDQVVVDMLDASGKVHTLYTGTPKNKKVVFVVPNIEVLYGKNVTLDVTAYTQKTKIKLNKKPKVYKPILSISGKVFDAITNTKSSYVTIAFSRGQHKVFLDENGEFSVEYPGASPFDAIVIVPSTATNTFKRKSVSLTYQTPSKFIILAGYDTTVPIVTDSDNDGHPDKEDAFPNDASEWSDNDGDGGGDNGDTDDDNDGMPDSFELAYGLNPLDASDKDTDLDGDGVSNYDEYIRGDDPQDPSDNKKSRYASLRTGWNLVGINGVLTLDELKSQLGVDNLLIIQGEYQTYKKEYANNALEFFNDFKKFERGKGYWIKVTEGKKIEYIPTAMENTIDLRSGWNLINPASELTIDDIILQLGFDNLLIIQGEYKTYKKEYANNALEFFNDFKKFEEPKGYWIKVKDDSQLNF